MIDAGARGAIDVLWSIGGNFLETLADPPRVRHSLAGIRARVHQDIVLSSAMLVDPAEEVWLLPATTRYESPGGGTETTTERRIVFSPEVPGRRVGEARPEWEVVAEVARRARPDRAARLAFADAAAVREEIARVVPEYAGMGSLRQKGDQVQWGGRTLFADGRFATSDGRAHFVAVQPTGRRCAPGKYLLSTRRGKQFNSMVQRDRDPLTGAARDDILISAQDLSDLELSAGMRVRLRSDNGVFEGRLRTAPLLPGNLEVHWPEGNVLLDPAALDDRSHEPDYNAMVSIEPLR
jgi:predicted molibdopterin-dependent oxidoreductase YjgC